MVRGGLVALLLLCAGCAEVGTDEIALIETGLIMPVGAAPLSEYTRFYAISSDGDAIDAEFVHGRDVSWILQHRRITRRVSDSVYIVHWSQLPQTMDGGCGIVTLRYDRRTRTMQSPACNGLA